MPSFLVETVLGLWLFGSFTNSRLHKTVMLVTTHVSEVIRVAWNVLMVPLGAARSLLAALSSDFDLARLSFMSTSSHYWI